MYVYVYASVCLSACLPSCKIYYLYFNQLFRMGRPGRCECDFECQDWAKPGIVLWDYKYVAVSEVRYWKSVYNAFGQIDTTYITHRTWDTLWLHWKILKLKPAPLIPIFALAGRLHNISLSFRPTMIYVWILVDFSAQREWWVQCRMELARG